MVYKKPRQAVLIDPETGEQIHAPLQLNFGPKGPQLDDWMHTFGCGLRQVTQLKLNGEQLNMLIYLLSVSDFDNRTACDAKHCYENTGIQSKNHRRAINVLLENEILRTAEKLGNYQLYHVNPMLGWKGNAKAWHAQVKQDIHYQTLSSSWLDLRFQISKVA